MKTIKLNENQVKRLFKEGRDEFSLAFLNSLKTLRQKYEYCIEHLGQPLGKGIGRVVFEIGDGEVIKLALPSDTIEGRTQNKNEYLIYEKLGKKYSIFTRVYQHSKNFSWITSEKVLQFHPQDSMQLLGIPYSSNNFDVMCMRKNIVKRGIDTSITYDEYPKQEPFGKMNGIEPTLSGFINWCGDIADAHHNGDLPWDVDRDNVYYELIKRNKWCEEFYNFMHETDGETDIHVDNLGLTMRNGEPYLVILDSGGEKLI